MPVQGHTSLGEDNDFPSLSSNENVITIDCLSDERGKKDPNSLLKAMGVRLVNFKGKEVTLVNRPKNYVREKQKLSKELQRLITIVNYIGVEDKLVKQVNL